MSVQQLTTNKIIIKKDNAIIDNRIDYKKNEIKSSKKLKSTNLYEESYFNKTGNIDINELATAITAKMVGGQVKIPKMKAVEVDIQRESAIGKIDQNAVQSEIIEGKVNNRVNKLKTLRKGRLK